jgi:hypothetical protein
MHPRIRRITTLVGTAALVGGGGLGVAQARESAGSSTQSRQSTQRDRGPTSAELSTLASKLGVTTAQLRNAMAAVRPDKPSGSRRDRGADLARSLASELDVEASAVREILDANRPGRPVCGAKPDNSALIAALAEGLNREQSAVTAAFEKAEAAKRAEHDARHAAMAAALAKELGLTTEAVREALDSVRPRKPTRAAA